MVDSEVDCVVGLITEDVTDVSVVLVGLIVVLVSSSLSSPIVIDSVVITAADDVVISFVETINVVDFRVDDIITTGSDTGAFVVGFDVEVAADANSLVVLVLSVVDPADEVLKIVVLAVLLIETVSEVNVGLSELVI